MHLSDQQLDLLRRGEMAAPEARAARVHVADCAGCAGRLHTLNREEAEVEALLRSVDHEAPLVDVNTVIRRAPARPRPARGVLAAGIATLVIATGAVAMPGSPVRQWLGALRSHRPVSAPQRPAPRPTDHDAAGTTGTAGISLAPGGSFEVVFDAAQRDGSIRITLGFGAELTVRADGGAVGYSVRPRGAWVQNAGSRATFDVAVPRDAPRVQIRVGDKVIFAKNGTTIRAIVPESAGGRYVVRFDAVERGA